MNIESRAVASSRSFQMRLVVLTVLVLMRSDNLVAQIQAHEHHSRVRVHFIAAEEVEWNYAPSGQDDAMGQPLDNSKKGYMESGPSNVGHSYKKCMYREYTDAKFDHLMDRTAEDRYMGLLGPILYAEVGDTLKIVFKNKASRAYSIHPHGVLYQKNSEGSGYNDGTKGTDKEDDAVPPGASHIYVWEVPPRAGPGPTDPSSVVWLYHSHVDEMRDIASGLFGAIVVTAQGKGRADAHPIDVDREFLSMMISVNESESWYHVENLEGDRRDLRPSEARESLAANPTGSGKVGSQHSSVETNLHHTINGYMYGNMPMLTMQKGQRVRWYLLTLGDSNNFHTPHWHGNAVDFHGHHTDVVSISPAQMETVDMIPDNPGIWLFHCHISDHMAGGMTARYRVLP